MKIEINNIKNQLEDLLEKINNLNHKLCQREFSRTINIIDENHIELNEDFLEITLVLKHRVYFPVINRDLGKII